MSYRTKGRDLLHNGNKIHLNGINWTGAEQANNLVPYAAWGSKSYPQRAKQIRSFGINAVRVPLTTATIANSEVNPDNIGWKWIADHYHLEGKKSLDVLKYYLESLEKEGIRYVLDHHYLEPGSGFPGDIPPLWYTDKFTEAQWLRDLETLASTFRDWEGFIGIDLKNEPNAKRCTWGDGDPLTDWKLAVDKAWNRISNVNDDIIVWVPTLSLEGGIGQIAANPPNIPKDRYAITHHEYGPDVWFGNPMFAASDFPRNMEGIWKNRIAKYAGDFNVNIGEFGGRNGETEGGIGKGGIQDRYWQEAMTDFLKGSGIDHFYWLADYTSHDTGGLFIDAGFDRYFESKARYFRKLVGPYTTFLGEHAPHWEEVKPHPKPDPKPEPEKPILSFTPGDTLIHKSFGGPPILYLGDGKGEFFTDRGDLMRLDVDEERFEIIVVDD